MENNVCERVSVGLREIRDEWVHCCLYIHLIVKISDANKTVPQRVGDERLFKRAEEKLQGAGNDMNINLRELGLSFAAQQAFLLTNCLLASFLQFE